MSGNILHVADVVIFHDNYYSQSYRPSYKQVQQQIPSSALTILSCCAFFARYVWNEHI
jgi:hypothetical protein